MALFSRMKIVLSKVGEALTLKTRSNQFTELQLHVLDLLTNVLGVSSYLQSGYDMGGEHTTWTMTLEMPESFSGIVGTIRMFGLEVELQ